MVERFDQARLVIQPPGPAMLLGERAVIECGCSIYVGLRIDTKESVTVGDACCTAHRTEVVGPAIVMLFDSLDDPSDRLLVEVCDEFLTAAAL